MSSVSTVINVSGEPCTNTPGRFRVRVHYTVVADDGGSVFGVFNTREQAEECLLVVAARTDVKAAELEVV